MLALMVFAVARSFDLGELSAANVDLDVANRLVLGCGHLGAVIVAGR